jgi:hypothetical protein
MMPKNTLTFPFSQTHVKLTDYDYKRELDIRHRMAHLSHLEVELLQEIIHQSLRISISSLAKHLEVSVQDLQPLLDRWSHAKLFTQQESTLIVDKEMRKFIEFQLEKFDEDFEPDLNFLQETLGRLPPTILLDWYAIPRTAHEFFPTIVTRFFINPQTYLNHLEQLSFKNATLCHLIEDIFKAVHEPLRAADLKQKYHLSDDQFGLYILILEYHFICCLSYRLVDGYWEEVVTPLKEWQEILSYEVKAQKAYLTQPIEKIHLSGLAFVETLQSTLKKFQAKKGKKTDPLYDELTQLGFLDHAHLSSEGESWLSQKPQEQMMTISAYFLDQLDLKKRFGDLWAIKQLRLVDSSLRRLRVNQWVQFNLFLKSLTISLGQRDPLSLKLKGTRWKYHFPVYTDLEKDFIKVALLERLSRFGVIEVGEFQGQPCFRLTAFGAHFIS